MDIGKFELNLADLVEAFESIEDPRSEVNRLHPLVSVLLIAVMAVLSGAGGPTAIARWANMKSQWLTGLLSLPHGIPQKDVFRRVLMSLNPMVFQACFADWVKQLAEAHKSSDTAKTILSIDGKTLRRSHDRAKGLGALHSVSVWAGDYGLTLAQVACADKSNEITAIPEVLKLVDIKGAIITIDAMGTQKVIARQIVAGGGDYVLALRETTKSFIRRWSSISMPNWNTTFEESARVATKRARPAMAARSAECMCNFRCRKNSSAGRSGGD
jgi:predicted transposase YbfD/YdcC